MSEQILAGRYRLLEMIGEGGMACVYRAIDQNTGHNVAIKIMKRELSQDADYISRFQREAEAASKMTHHNIVNLLDVGMEGNDRFLVMEYVQGKTLKQLIQEKGRLNVTTAAEITIRILSALQHAHQNGIVHRDIKPQNILVASDGHIKVSDFGIARIVNSHTLTRDDSVMGTVYYYSPEQASGQKVEATSDIYSVGVVLYEMLTGRVPFDGESQVVIAMQHLHKQPVPIEELVPGVPPAICYVCMKAMEKDPRSRYQSARAMAEDLKNAKEGRLTPALPLNGDSRAADAVQGGSQGGQAPVKKKKERKPFRLDAVSMRRIGWGLITAAVAAMMIFGLYIGGVSIYEKVVNSVNAPDLTDIEFTQAERIATRVGLAVEKVEINHPNISRGMVILQAPEEGTPLRKGDGVVLTVSKGPVSQTVPRLVGMTLSDAIVAANAYGLTLTVVEYVASGDVQTNFVMSQVPDQTTHCEPGDVVQVTVSGGLVNVPLVEGASIADATALLQASGLTVSSNVQFLNTVDAKLHGLVASQSPAAASPVMQGTTVYLTVYQVPGLSHSTQVILDLPSNGEDIDVRVTLVSGGMESNVYQGTYPADASRHPLVTITAQMPGEYVYKVYCNGKFSYQQTVKLE